MRCTVVGLVKVGNLFMGTRSYLGTQESSSWFPELSVLPHRSLVSVWKMIHPLWETRTTSAIRYIPRPTHQGRPEDESCYWRPSICEISI